MITESIVFTVSLGLVTALVSIASIMCIVSIVLDSLKEKHD